MNVPHKRLERIAYWQKQRQLRDETKKAQHAQLVRDIKARYGVEVKITPMTDIPKLLRNLAQQHKRLSRRKTHIDKQGQTVPTRYPAGRP